MPSPRRITAQITPVLVTLGVSALLAACGNSTTEHPPTSAPSAQPQPPSSTSASAAAPAAYDISRIDNLKDDFPPGFTVETHPAKTLDQSDIDSSRMNEFTQAQVDPPQCRGLVIPPYTDPSVGAQAAGVRADGDQGTVYVVAHRMPEAVPVSQPPAGCDRVSLSGSPEATGTAERIPAPEIAGATTTGAKLSTSKEEDPDYIFTAALDDQTSIVVIGGIDPSLNPQQFLSDLLVKAAAAVRGQ
jgi:hypothetical protein